MAYLFWISFGAIIYVYFGYPFLIRFLSLAKNARKRKTNESRIEELPSVSLIIAAYNEEKVIAAKLSNALSLDYPREKLEIIVVSDGSTDRTDEIAGAWRDKGVKLLRVEGRRGKTATQNAAASIATGEILVFSDANAIYNKDSLKYIAARFSDESVGCVEGRRSDVPANITAASKYELSYRDWESRIKVWESGVLSCTGATGPIYAVRKSLYIPLPEEMISDFMEPALIMSRYRKRHVFEPRAVSHELISEDVKESFARKVRIITRCLCSLKMAPEVLNPFKSGWFAWQVFSHRLMRWLVPYFGILAYFANVFLIDRPFYKITFALASLFLLAGAVGFILEKMNLGSFLFRAPCVFLTANLAAFTAGIRCLASKNITVWQTNRPSICSSISHFPPITR